MTNNGVNLLPVQRQEALAKTFSYRIVMFYGKAFITLLVFFAVELFVLGLAFRIEARALEERALEDAPTLKEFADLERRSRVETERLSAVKAFLRQTAPLHPLLERALSDMPAAIQLRSINFRREDRMLTLTGYAQTREGLLDLEAQLKGIPGITNVVIPVASFLKASDVDFVVNMQLGETSL